MMQTSWTDERRAECFVNRGRSVLSEEGQFEWVIHCQGDDGSGVSVRREVEPGAEIGGAGASDRDARRRFVKAPDSPST